MPDLPKPTRLVLHDAIRYIARQCNTDLAEAGRAILYALVEGRLIASANVLERDRSPGIGAATWVDCGVHPAPATLWVDCSGPEFEKRALHPRGNPQYRHRASDGTRIGPVFVTPTIATADIDHWLASASSETASSRVEAGRDETAAPSADDLKPLPPSGIRTTRAVDAERRCAELIVGLSDSDRKPKDAVFTAAKKHCGEALSRKAFDRAWANAAPAAWKRGGRHRK